MALTFPSSPTTGQTYSPGAGLPTWMWDGNKWTNATTPPLHLASLSDVAVTGAADNTLLTYDAASQTWKAGGSAVINGDGGAGLTVNAPGGITVAGPAATGLSALTIGQSGQNAWVFYNPPSIGDLRIQSTTYGTAVAFSPQGYTTFGPPATSFSAVVVRGAQGANAMQIYGGTNTVATGNFCLAVNASSSSAIGTQSGIYIMAGSATSDSPLVVGNTAGTTMSNFRGDGSGYLGPPTGYAMAWNADRTVAFGNVPHAPGATGNLALNLNGILVYGDTSARRFKTNIRDVSRERARGIVSRLRAITFNWLDPSEDQRENFGLIAEEVEEVEPALVGYDKEGQPISVNYNRVFLTLLPLMQELLEERGYG